MASSTIICFPAQDHTRVAGAYYEVASCAARVFISQSRSAFPAVTDKEVLISKELPELVSR